MVVVVVVERRTVVVVEGLVVLGMIAVVVVALLPSVGCVVDGRSSSVTSERQGGRDGKRVSCR